MTRVGGRSPARMLAAHEINLLKALAVAVATSCKSRRRACFAPRIPRYFSTSRVSADLRSPPVSCGRTSQKSPRRLWGP
eukprot:scaffold4847_cov265-Pinguiococcus_pyrenoidosus.AAC.9